jgi:hypothetical protein
VHLSKKIRPRFPEARSYKETFVPGLQKEPERVANRIKPKLDKAIAQLKATMSHFAIAEA